MIWTKTHTLALRSVYRAVPDYAYPIHWYEAGDEDAPTLLLMHGFMAHSMAFRRVADALSQDYRLIIPDLPAHGRDRTYHDHRVEPTVASLEAWFQVLLNELDTPMHVVGHSLGAVISYRAVQDLDCIESLIMVAPGLKIPSQPFAKTAVGLIPSRLSRFVFTHRNTKIFEPLQWRGEPMDDFEIAAYAQPLRQPDRMKFMLELAADLLTEPDRTGHVGPVDIPSLLVWGAEDRTIPVQNAFDVKAKLPDTELFILEHSGHSPMEDTPDEFLQVFWDFHAELAKV